MIMDQDEHHHAPLLTLMILSLGDEYLSEPELANGATTRWIVREYDLRSLTAAEPDASEAGYEPLCGEQEFKALHLVSRGPSDCFALLNMPLITCEAAEGIQIGQRAVA